MAQNRRKSARQVTAIKPPWGKFFRDNYATGETAIVASLWGAGFAAADLMVVAILMGLGVVTGLLAIAFKPIISSRRKMLYGSFLAAFFGISGAIAYWRHPPDPLQEITQQFEQLRREQNVREILSSNPAVLTPDSKLYRATTCSQPGSMNVLLGGSSIGSSRLPFSPIMASGKPLITLSRVSSGNLAISFDLRDENGNLLARSDEDKVLIIPTRAFMPSRTSVHQLIIFNDKGERALEIEYVNNTTIRITGIFYAGRSMMKIDDQNITVNGAIYLSDVRICDLGGISIP